jgi:hypothetical protein
MPMMPSRLRVLAAVLTLTSGIGFAAQGEFEKRWKEAERNVTSGPGRAYFTDVFFKDSLVKLTGHMSECGKKTGETPSAELRAAVELSASGRVLTVLTGADSKTEGCFAELVRKDTFPTPPADHFWVPVRMGFSTQ